MPTPVNLSVQGYSAMVTAIKVLQTFNGQTVSSHIDNQMIQKEIIKLQTFLSTQTATNPPSNKKIDPAKICTTIDDQFLSAKIVDLQNGSNLT
jgi:hypothetical protein